MGDEYDPSELVCGACSDVSRAQVIQGSTFCFFMYVKLGILKSLPK